MVAEAGRFQHRIDSLDRIEWVDDWWLAFARENGAAGLTKEAVLGRSIWGFVTGENLQALYRALHAQLRSSGESAVVPFRCDSPHLRRHMQMRISPQLDGGLLYDCSVVRVQPRKPLYVLDPSRPHSEAFLTMCSCCERVLVETSGWMEIDDASLRLRLFESDTTPQLHHSICPECTQMLMNAADGAA